ncbi:hypothetical protein ACYOEI_36960, partial [Singulisphaera rosea]
GASRPARTPRGAIPKDWAAECRPDANPRRRQKREGVDPKRGIDGAHARGGKGVPPDLFPQTSLHVLTHRGS